MEYDKLKFPIRMQLILDGDFTRQLRMWQTTQRLLCVYTGENGEKASRRGENYTYGMLTSLKGDVEAYLESLWPETAP